MNTTNTIENINKYMKDIDVEFKKVGGDNPHLIHFNFYDCSNIIDGLVLEVVDEAPGSIVRIGKLHYTDNAEDFINNIDFTNSSYNEINSLTKKIEEGEYEDIKTIKSFLRRKKNEWIHCVCLFWNKRWISRPNRKGTPRMPSLWTYTVMFFKQRRNKKRYTRVFNKKLSLSTLYRWRDRPNSKRRILKFKK